MPDESKETIPSEHTAIKVRIACLENALLTFQNMRDAAYTPVDIENLAKSYEKYIWGLLGPNNKPATPLNTITEAAEAVKKHLTDLRNGYLVNGDPDGLNRIDAAMAIWERFLADISFALEPNP